MALVRRVAAPLGGVGGTSFSSAQLNEFSYMAAAAAMPVPLPTSGQKYYGGPAVTVQAARDQLASVSSVISRSEKGFGGQIKPGTPLMYQPVDSSGAPVGGLQSRLLQESGHSFIPVSQLLPLSLPGSDKSTGTGSRDAAGRSPGSAGYGNTYNEVAFEGPYLTTKYDMGGYSTPRTFGVDYPYDTDKVGGLLAGETASQFFTRAMYNNKINDLDEINSSTFKLSAAPSISIRFGPGSGATGSGKYVGTGVGFSF